MRAEEFTQQASLEDPERLINLLGQVEGERWVREQLTKITPLTVRYSATIYRQAKEYQKEMPDSTIRELMYDLDSDSVVIYGAGGYNRYSVGDNGLVYPIDESFPNKEKLQLAKQLLSGSKAMKITEIEKIPARDFSGVDTIDGARRVYRNSTEFKKFSDSDFYYLNDMEHGKILIAVPNTDAIRSTPNGLLIVGVLNLYPKSITNIYNLPVEEVGTIAVDKKYRGQGIAGKLYDAVLKSGRILFAGDTQTPNGRAMWSNLYRRPDIEVTGWVRFYVNDVRLNVYTNDEFIKFIEQQGGAYFGERITPDSGKVMFFEFEVEQLPTKAELEIRGKKSPITVYNTEGADTGLMARYIG